MSSVATREVSPFLIRLRSLFLGRVATNPLRFQKDMAARPGPEANLVEGPSHKLASNYYFTRDARREVGFPTLVASNEKAAKALPQPAAEGDAAAAAPKAVSFPKKGATPGKLYQYSQ